MSTSPLLVAFFLVLAAPPVVADQGTASAVANPVRRVVDMLQMMQQKVTAEGDKEAELIGKFTCYCKTSGGDLKTSIAAAETKIPQVESAITEAEATKVRVSGETEQHRADRDAAKATMAEATTLREKEAAAFAKAKGEYDANIAAVTAAIAAVSKGMGGGFLQTTKGQVLRPLIAEKQDLSDADRQDVLAFLSGTQSTGYAPQGGEINGILKQLQDNMKAELATLTANEEAAIKAFAASVAAKKKQVAVLSASIEAKLENVAQLGVDVANMKNDLEDTQEAHAEDQKFLADLDKSCASKASEWEERKLLRAEELQALAETIKVLNDDDALELFKQTLPSASGSFVQLRTTHRALTTRALRIINGVPRRDWRGARPELDFLALAVQGKKMNFDKVLKMIDTLVAALGTEQANDDQKKEYCAKELDDSDDQKKSLERSIEGLENAIADAEENLETVTAEIKALEAGIAALDKEVAEATAQRKAEHDDFTQLTAEDTAAKKLLEFAKNRLNKFYNPKLYIPPPERDLTEEQRITVNLGGDVPTVAPGGIAGTGIAVLTQVSSRQFDAPPPPPETFGAYAKQGEKNTGVIAMIDLLVTDLNKDMDEAKTAEEHAQANYEEMMQDSSAKRTQDAKSLTQKQTAKAGLEGDLAQHGEAKGAASKELTATLKYIQSVHNECDWLLQYFDVRKEARANEVGQLKQAKAVLSGADFTML